MRHFREKRIPEHKRIPYKNFLGKKYVFPRSLSQEVVESSQDVMIAYSDRCATQSTIFRILAPLAPARRQARMIMPVARRARASWIPGVHGTIPDSGCSRPPAHRLPCAAFWQQGDAAARARTHRARKISPLRLTAEVASMRTPQAKPLPCAAHAAPTQGGPGGAS